MKIHHRFKLLTYSFSVRIFFNILEHFDLKGIKSCRSSHDPRIVAEIGETKDLNMGDNKTIDGRCESVRGIVWGYKRAKERKNK